MDSTELAQGGLATAPAAAAASLTAMVRAISADDAWQTPLAAACAEFDIDTARRQSMFLAQCAHESGGFTRLVESLHYSASQLLATWPARFTAQDAVELAFDDVRIGERVYGGRLGNQAEGCGDGYRYRGRGLLQITGRANYARCGAGISLDVETSPEDLAQPFPAALSAAWYWARMGCNELADDGRFQSITLRINGGLIGLTDRLAWLDKVQEALA